MSLLGRTPFSNDIDMEQSCVAKARDSWWTIQKLTFHHDHCFIIARPRNPQCANGRLFLTTKVLVPFTTAIA